MSARTTTTQDVGPSAEQMAHAHTRRALREVVEEYKFIEQEVRPGGAFLCYRVAP